MDPLLQWTDIDFDTATAREAVVITIIVVIALVFRQRGKPPSLS